ncbi:Hypothetical_protein [Hexamita inflata]|uniref:Hypothetical_protein n=1 Tax=Hexamita inflata TaxID=28002 RepID=A0AA86Q619_9EUKA|nr:Hypothetical protein HINF_LOCUS37662 [Hexamita inflata]
MIHAQAKGVNIQKNYYDYNIERCEDICIVSINLNPNLQKLSLFQEFMTQYNERLEQIRCPCAYRVQCGLSCCHEMIILSHLDALKNKYLITSLVRVEYSQQYLNEKLPLYFQAREFYTLHSYEQQDSKQQIPARPRTFQSKNRQEMMTYIKSQLNVLHNLELNHPPLFEYRHPSSFQKWPGCLQVRANLFGIFPVSDLVSHFSYRHLFQKFSENLQFLDLICINYHYIEDQVAYNLYIWSYKVQKLKKNKQIQKRFTTFNSLTTPFVVQLQTLLLQKIEGVCI